MVSRVEGLGARDEDINLRFCVQGSGADAWVPGWLLMQQTCQPWHMEHERIDVFSATCKEVSLQALPTLLRARLCFALT